MTTDQETVAQLRHDIEACLPFLDQDDLAELIEHLFLCGWHQ